MKLFVLLISLNVSCTGTGTSSVASWYGYALMSIYGGVRFCSLSGHVVSCPWTRKEITHLSTMSRC